MSDIRLEKSKKVITRSADGRENGWLMELLKDKATGNLTESYLTVTSPGAFKGYHLHRVRAARYACLRGNVRITTYTLRDGAWESEEHMMRPGDRMFIPKDVATGIENPGVEEGWLVNFPDPAYDPSLKDEQVEYTKEELESGVVK